MAAGGVDTPPLGDEELPHEVNDEIPIYYPGFR